MSFVFYKKDDVRNTRLSLFYVPVHAFRQPIKQTMKTLIALPGSDVIYMYTMK